MFYLKCVRTQDLVEEESEKEISFILLLTASKSFQKSKGNACRLWGGSECLIISWWLVLHRCFYGTERDSKFPLEKLESFAAGFSLPDHCACWNSCFPLVLLYRGWGGAVQEIQAPAVSRLIQSLVPCPEEERR